MITNEELLRWIQCKIEGTRLKAMHAYKRGDNIAFENINKELSYWMALEEAMSEKVKQDGNVDG